MSYVEVNVMLRCTKTVSTHAVLRPHAVPAARAPTLVYRRNICLDRAASPRARPVGPGSSLIVASHHEGVSQARVRDPRRRRECGPRRGHSAGCSICSAARTRGAARARDRAAVGPSRDARARHGRDAAPAPRRLRHRLARRARRAARGRHVLARRLRRASCAASSSTSARRSSTSSPCASRPCRCSRRSRSMRLQVRPRRARSR